MPCCAIKAWRDIRTPGRAPLLQVCRPIVDNIGSMMAVARPTPNVRLPARACAVPLRIVAGAVLLAAASMASAQYKVVGPDGKVTYTDRSPSPSAGQVTSLNARNAAVVQPDADLPFELRAVVTKYPVTLYTVTGNCEPCVAARQLLRQRGVPYAERQVVTGEDGDALEKLTGARDAPTLTIGAQTLRGLAPDVWASYLEAAGYPRDSRLPATYQYRAATPIVERREATAVRTPAVAATGALVRPEAAAPAASGIRF